MLTSLRWGVSSLWFGKQESRSWQWIHYCLRKGNVAGKLEILSFFFFALLFFFFCETNVNNGSELLLFICFFCVCYFFSLFV